MPSMPEEGVVIESGEAMARVQMPRSSYCQTCHRSGTICDPFGADRMIVEAQNQSGARKGDVVQVEFLPIKVGKGAAVAYVTPLLALLVGAILGNVLDPFGSNDLSAAVFALALLVVSVAALYAVRRKLAGGRGSEQARIVRILRRQG
jgi:sigma-E factor negative regulatory protein RseC